jgi:hypothetical protein
VDDYTNKAIQQLREDEGLTNNLTDESAKVLLAWAESLIKRNNQPGGIKDIVPVNNAEIMELVRAINRLSGNQLQMSEIDFLQGILNLLNTVLTPENAKKL